MEIQMGTIGSCFYKEVRQNRGSEYKVAFPWVKKKKKMKIGIYTNALNNQLAFREEILELLQIVL